MFDYCLVLRVAAGLQDGYIVFYIDVDRLSSELKIVTEQLIGEYNVTMADF